ncbi:hypothetical protein JYU34_018930 [Plutella xylostella]|uniref:Uncharacterized protein n=1 Tax=Plutella xylostella TaxID=51655 RepID=A0ABQ7PYT9_PLUXY|nr:hypothetical protein JYU34_018930 [Plutella xylostella]
MAVVSARWPPYLQDGCRCIQDGGRYFIKIAVIAINMALVRWVRVYRGAHACGGGRGREHDAFQLAARDTRTELLLAGMEPDTRSVLYIRKMALAVFKMAAAISSRWRSL